MRAVFRWVSEGDYEAMLQTLGPTFSYRFYGDHALAGERHTVEAIRLWWQRVLRLLPGAESSPNACW